MNRTTLALLTLALPTIALPAQASTVDLSGAHVAHQLESASSARDRLQLHVDRFCKSYCERLRVDVGVVRDALKNFEHQVYHGSQDPETSRVAMVRVLHQFEAARSALGRMAWVATRQDDARRRRVTIDVGILADVVTNLENHAKNLERAQRAAAELAKHRAEGRAKAKRAPALAPPAADRPLASASAPAKLPAPWTLRAATN